MFTTFFTAKKRIQDVIFSMRTHIAILRTFNGSVDDVRELFSYDLKHAHYRLPS